MTPAQARATNAQRSRNRRWNLLVFSPDDLLLVGHSLCDNKYFLLIIARFTMLLLSSCLSLDYELGTDLMLYVWTFTLFITIVIDKFLADEWIEYVVTDRHWRMVPLVIFYHLCGYLILDTDTCRFQIELLSFFTPYVYFFTIYFAIVVCFYIYFFLLIVLHYSILHLYLTVSYVFQ